MNERLLAGRYRLEENLDAAGEIEVWRALDERRRRTVIIRMPKIATVRDFRGAFEGEIEASKALRDRSLVRALTVGEENGVDYLVTEFAEGRTLEEMLEHDAVPSDPTLAARLVADLCRLVAHARRARIPHLALEPRHVVIGRGSAKVIRFRAGPDDAGVSLEATRYAAPEQDTVAVATEEQEVYNLGALLCALLTGTPSAQGDGRPSALLDIARKATAADASSRYASVAALLDALRLHRERSGIQRHLRPIVGLAAVAVAVGILATWFLRATVAVPPVVGMQVPEAAQTMRRAMLVPDSRSGAAAAVVGRQRPAAGARVKPRSTVHLLAVPPRSPR